MNSFRFKTGIPHHFALSVMFIAHGRDKKKSWALIREKYAEKAPVFDWIESILKDNQVDDPMSRLGWWKARLQGH